MEFSQNNVNVYKSWINALNLPVKNNFKNMLLHHKKIYDYITKNYTNDTTVRTYISALAKLFKVLKGKKSNLYKKYSKISVDLQKKIQQNDLKQDISEHRKNNFLTFTQIINRREDIKNLFMKKPTDNKLNQQYLLLCLYTMQPPIRMEYKDMEIVKSIPNNKGRNYILQKNNQFSSIINKDKVSNIRGCSIFTFSNELNEAILLSLRHYPRQYILSLNTNPSKPIGKQSFEILLRSCFDNKNIGVDIVRASYITHFYNKRGVTMEQKEELAKLMRSSVAMASTIYHKIFKKEYTDEDVVDEMVAEIQNIDDKEQLKRRVLDIINDIRKKENKTRKT